MKRVTKTMLVWAAFFLLVAVGCKQKSAIPASAKLQGEWIYNGNRPQLFTFSGDSVEFMEGFFCSVDSNSFVKFRHSEYRSQFAKFKLKSDSILYLEPCIKKWQLLGQIKKLSDDTLQLVMPQPDKRKAFIFHKTKALPVTDPEFDQITFSLINWNYTPATPEISVKKNGEVYFSGATWKNPPGIYTGILSPKDIHYLFTKVRNANFLNLRDSLAGGTIDGATATISLIKNGRIIKRVSHTGLMLQPSFMDLMEIRLWQAYHAFQISPYKIALKPSVPALPVSALNHIIFYTSSKTLELTPSDGLFFLTELQKSKAANASFKPLYTVLYNEKFRTLGKHAGQEPEPFLFQLKTDGRYFEFPDKNGKSKVYDLGYDFLAKNNLTSRFRNNTSEDFERIESRIKGNL